MLLDADVMSVTLLPSDNVTVFRLVSSLVSVVAEDTCLSFLVHFNSSTSVKLSTGTMVNQSDDVSTLGMLFYPFDRSFLTDSDSSQLFRIRVPLVAGINRLVLSAEGSGAATVSV